MYKLGDLQTLWKSHNKNWALIIPLGAILGPLLSLGRGQESALPTLLVIPSLFYAGLFAYSILIELRTGHNKDIEKPPPNNISQHILNLQIKTTITAALRSGRMDCDLDPIRASKIWRHSLFKKFSSVFLRRSRNNEVFHQQLIC